MTDKHRKLLKDKIEELGLYKASRSFGLSMAEILNYSKIKINHNYAYEVLLELIGTGKIPTKYKGFTIEYDGDYAVRWYGSHFTDEFGPTLRETISCLATPLHDGRDIIPIDLDYYALEDPKNRDNIFEHDLYGDYQGKINVDNKFENIEELLEWYRDF